jgi:hypothetical protein
MRLLRERAPPHMHPVLTPARGREVVRLRVFDAGAAAGPGSHFPVAAEVACPSLAAAQRLGELLLTSARL